MAASSKISPTHTYQCLLVILSYNRSLNNYSTAAYHFIHVSNYQSHVWKYTYVLCIAYLYYCLLLLVPSEVRLLEISFNSSSVTLQWRAPESPNGVVTHYSLQLNENNIVNISSNMLMYAAGELSPDTVYILQLRAHNGAGAGPSSNRTFVTSKLLSILQ